ncbi:MAG: AsmA family protein, partial [Chromatiaceae bacterium]
MAKVLKLIAGLLVLAILLVVAAALLAPYVVNPNTFKGDIEAQVEAATGRKLTIAGDIGISVFPWLGVDVRAASLSDLPGFGAGPFAELKRAKIRTRLLPLIERRLEVDRVELDGLRVHLIRNAQGEGNWVGLLGDAESASNIQTAFPPPASQAARKPGAGDALVAGLAVAGIELVNARVDWEDQRTGQRFSVDKLDFTSGTVIPGQPVDVQLSGDALNADSGILARFAGTGTVTLDADLHRLAVEPLEVRVAHLKTAEGLSAKAKISAKLKGDLDAGRYAVDDLKIAAEVDGKPLSGGQIAATAEARVDLDLAAETLKVKDLAIRSDALQITGNSEGQHILSAPAYSGRLALPELDLRAWLKQHGLPLPDTADPAALRRFALTAGWRLAGARLALTDLVVTLDQSRMTGSAEILQTAPPGYRFDLSVDKLDLDRYLPDREGSKHLPPASVAETAPSAPSDARAPASVAAKVSPQ